MSPADLEMLAQLLWPEQRLTHWHRGELWIRGEGKQFRFNPETLKGLQRMWRRLEKRGLWRHYCELLLPLTKAQEAESIYLMEYDLLMVPPETHVMVALSSLEAGP